MKRTNLLRLLVAPSLCSAPVLLAGCTAGEIDEIPPPDTLTLIEDSRYMANLLEAKPDEGQRSYHNIDLSDDRQHRFVVNRLLASGNTPKSSPRLFELLAQARASAVASPPSRQEGSEPVAFRR